MRQYALIPLTVCVLLLAGQGCPSRDMEAPPEPEAPGQPTTEGSAQPEDQAGIPAHGFQLRTLDGKAVLDNIIRYRHVVGGNPCPDRLEDIIVDLGGAAADICSLSPLDLPKWLSGRKPEQAKPAIGHGVVLGLEFNCNIDDRSTHKVEITAGFALDCMGNELINGWRSGDRVDIPVVLDLQGK